MVPRCYFERRDTPTELKLHVFADASLNAMCASAYIRAKFPDNTAEAVFVVGKARVAPMKQLTVPKLELQSAVIACRLLDLIKKEHDWTFDKVFLWSDSTTVLQWIRSSHKKHPVFVANRLGEILESTSVDQWRYVPTDQNPADCGTRGLTVEELNKSHWISGPRFLLKNEKKWPADISIIVEPEEDTNEQRECDQRTSDELGALQLFLTNNPSDCLD